MIFYHFIIVVAAILSAKTSTTHCHTIVPSTTNMKHSHSKLIGILGQKQETKFTSTQCDFRICLADVDNTKCECPDDAAACVGDPSVDVTPVGRRRRSISDSVDESQLYRVVYGPFTFQQEELNKDEGK